MPTYLRATGMNDLQEIGALSAIPWVVSLALADKPQCALLWQCTQGKAMESAYGRPWMIINRAVCMCVAKQTAGV